MIKEKEKEQIAQIMEHKEKIKKEIISLDQEVKRITGVIVNRISPFRL